MGGREGKCEEVGTEREKPVAFLLYFGQWMLTSCFNELVKRLILVHSHHSGSVFCYVWSGDSAVEFYTAVEFFTAVPKGEAFLGTPGKSHREENLPVP